MKLKLLFISLTLLLCVNCNTYKTVNTALLAGDFDQAFQKSLETYLKNPSSKNAEKYMPIIYEAYSKAQETNEARIKELQNSDDPHKYEELYTLLNNLQRRQKEVQGINEKVLNNVTYDFKTKDYTKAFNTVRNKYATYLFEEGNSWLNRYGKEYAKKAYSKFQLLESIYPNYLDTRSLLAKSKELGTYKVLIQLTNDTEVIIPKRLEQDLLDFNSYGLDTEWTQFYTVDAKVSFDYIIQLSFQSIQVSPEQEKVEGYNFEKRLLDGKKELEKNGQVVKDSEGKPIMVDHFITVKCKFEEYKQRKEANISATYYLIDNTNRKAIESKNLASSFIFMNNYGRYFGDPRALDAHLIKLSTARPLPFPSNEQMIFDSGKELKRKFSTEIKRLKL